MSDPLATLQRLRKLEADYARRDLAAALATEIRAQAAQSEAAEALQREAAAHPADISHALARAFASWRPVGVAALQSAAAARHTAETDVAARRNNLAASRAAERAVELLQANQNAVRDSARKRRQQAVLDDFRGGPRDTESTSF